MVSVASGAARAQGYLYNICCNCHCFTSFKSNSEWKPAPNVLITRPKAWDPKPYLYSQHGELGIRCMVRVMMGGESDDGW